MLLILVQVVLGVITSVMMQIAIASATGVGAQEMMQIAKPGCQHECGGVKIPYPFGIGPGCFYNYFYSITCNSTTNPPTPIYGTNIQVLNVTLDDHSFLLNTLVSYDCYQSNQSSNWSKSYLYMAEFTVNTTSNKFVAIGCDTKATFQGYRFGNDYYFTGCNTYCTSMQHIKNGTCSGVGCCETPVPDGTTHVNSSLSSYFNHSRSSFNPCSAAFVVEDGAFNFSTVNLTYQEDHFTEGGLRVPTVFDWSILNATCNPTKGQDKVICGSNTECIDGENATLTKSYRCICWSGYSGNPYLLEGCQDVNECTDSKLNDCEKMEYCVNKPGTYECKCPQGYHGNATYTDRCIADTVIQEAINLPTGVKVGIGLGIGFIFLLVGGIFVRLYYEKKRLLDLKKSFFVKNGGLILHQKLCGQDISIQKFKIFTTEELDTATANFSESNIIGRGGFGMVYKGTLLDGQEIAIKRSLKVDPTQVDQFINETLVLSEINNRNVVKLLGCCLDTEVPLLVYEFINNGTLYEHLHDERKASLLSLDICLSIAEAVASVLSYLHTTIAIPIIHRDMKSMNILLDENYTAKVSDFGASKLVPIDQDQLATVVLGTCGYLDPEYMQTHELTQKSDVYSFGVVLVELLTRKKAFSYNMPEAEKSLAMHFLCKMKEDRVLDIVDRAIVMNGNLEQVKAVAELARECLRLRGEERPTMKEVATELESIWKMARDSSYIVATLPEECRALLTYPVEDNEGNIAGSTTSNIPSGNLLLDFDGGR